MCKRPATNHLQAALYSALHRPTDGKKFYPEGLVQYCSLLFDPRSLLSLRIVAPTPGAPLTAPTYNHCSVIESKKPLRTRVSGGLTAA